jgi:sulfite exporter TauE/SafE
LGSELYHSGLSTSLKLVSVIVLSALLALSGWQMLVGPGRPSVVGQFFANISHGLFPKLAQNFGHYLGRFPEDIQLALKSFFAGAASGFLPCGWLYSFVILAITTQSAILGATLLLAFWLGTLPALVGLSYGAGRLSHIPWAQRLRPVAQRLIGAAFILLAITLILQKTTGVLGSPSFLASHHLAELILQSFTDSPAQPAYDPQSFLCQ